MTSENIDGGAVAEVANLARQGQEPRKISVKTPDGVEFPIVVGPEGSVLDIARYAHEWRDAPRRRSGTAKAFTLESFVDLTKRHADENSAIFASILSDSPSLTAVIDYHTTEKAPRFCKHHVAYDFPLSPEWKAWKGKNAQSMGQGDFAQWIEDHIAEIASPLDAEKAQFEAVFGVNFATGSSIMSLAKGLQINVESKVGAVTNLQTGEGQIQWEEAHKDSDGKPLKVPGLFVVNIPLFVGGDNVRIITRLRYRKEGGKLSWSYLFYRWEETFRNALCLDVERVGKDTGLPVYEGSPEA